MKIDESFMPDYEVLPDKRKVVDDLSKLAEQAQTVWLASDEDREGEAIAWHLAEVLELPVDKTKRIVFHEITKNAILHAIENPRTIDMNFGDAQQARRVLVRIVGFELSPVLWKKVKPALSAGRVQAVAVRLIVEREREIIAFQSTPYFRVVAQFYPAADESKTIFKAELNRRFETKEEAEAFLHNAVGASFSVSKAEEKPMKRYPAAPFTTSTLQQEAGRKLGMSVAQTMSVAQHLYEQGLITYMRTDSVNLSAQAIAQCKQEISKHFGEKYSSAHNYKTKTKGAQEAHAAIRPSYIDRVEIDGTAAEKRLYDLIWKRTVASQMVAAEVDRTTVVIDMNGSESQFVASGEVVRFDGFLRLYSESVDEDQLKDSSEEALLPKMQVGDSVISTQIVATERFTTAPPRYNEASLVKRLEELGIGRPSTYAPTIQTIQNREYVVKSDCEGSERNFTVITLSKNDIKETTKTETVGADKNKLQPTDIGIVVNDFLMEYFPDVMDYNFSANVEKEFDAVAEGEMVWTDAIDHFYKMFHPIVEKAIAIRTEHKVGERCLGNDPKSGRPVFVKIGRYGPVVQIGQSNPDDKNAEKPQFATLRKGQSIETITLEEALKLFDLPRTLGEFEDKVVVAAIGRFGPFIRHDGKFDSIPKTLDPLTITLEEAIELIKQKRQSDEQRFLKKFEEEPELEILKGRFGPYIAYKGANYKIPKTVENPAELSLDECKKIIEESAAKPAAKKRVTRKKA